MDILFKIIAIGIITCVATIIIRPIRNDFAIVLAIVGGLIIIFMLADYLLNIFSIFKDIVDISGINSNLYKLLLKIIGVGYLIEFTSSICIDTGNISLSDKILLGGKIIILVMALPIVINILEIIKELLPL